MTNCLHGKFIRITMFRLFCSSLIFTGTLLLKVKYSFYQIELTIRCQEFMFNRDEAREPIKFLLIQKSITWTFFPFIFIFSIKCKDRFMYSTFIFCRVQALMEIYLMCILHEPTGIQCQYCTACNLSRHCLIIIMCMESNNGRRKKKCKIFHSFLFLN